jgi:hypothetical protein
MAIKEYLNHRLNSLKNEVPTLKKKVATLESGLTALDVELDTFTSKIDNLNSVVDQFTSVTERNFERQIKKLQTTIEKLEKKLAEKEGDGRASSNPVILDKAKTIAIFDAVLSSITSWSLSGDQASDIEAASQSILFPSVYERVMGGGDPAYLLDDVPDSAELVVQRGREYVRWIRSECEGHITTPENWEQYAPQIQRWWVNDGLPLLYGEADPDWEHDSPYSLEEIEVWRKNPADRIMVFPQIQDAMDILQKQRQEVNKSTSLVKFNQATAATRLS